VTGTRSKARQARSLFSLAGLSWRELGKRVAASASHDEITGRAAQLAYYFFAALFPLLLFLTAVLGLIADPQSQLRQQVISRLTEAMPPSASGLVQQVVTQTSQASGHGKLTIGILLALISASAGMGAVFDALNSAYHLKETRGFFRRRFLAMALTIAVSALVVVATAVILYGEEIAEWVGSAIHLSGLTVIAWKILQWPVAIVFLLAAFALVYYVAPDRREKHWHWASPGAVIGVLLWLVVSCGLRVYLHFFNTYSATYGSLGAVMILLLWFYVSGLAVLLGGEVNSVVEAAAAERSQSQAAGKA